MIITAIEANLDALRPSEQAVARFVLGRPSVVVHMSIADIAESCEVSEPTIMRFCKALGCLGFMEFKLALARDLERRTFTMSRENPFVKGPTLFGQALFSRVVDDLASAAGLLGLEHIDTVLEFVGASRAITIVHDGSEDALAAAMTDTMLACRLEARAQTDLTLRERSDGRVVLALRSAAQLAGFGAFCDALNEGEGKIILIGADHAHTSICIGTPSFASSGAETMVPELVYLALCATLRLGIAARLSRDGLFSDTASDILQSQREIAYGDARRRDRQIAQNQNDNHANAHLNDGKAV
jgi:RpiR family transcriptional regulator, carbohydrate utilization regulator